MNLEPFGKFSHEVLTDFFEFGAFWEVLSRGFKRIFLNLEPKKQFNFFLRLPLFQEFSHEGFNGSFSNLEPFGKFSHEGFNGSFSNLEPKSNSIFSSDALFEKFSHEEFNGSFQIWSLLGSSLTRVLTDLFQIWSLLGSSLTRVLTDLFQIWSLFGKFSHEEFNGSFQIWSLLGSSLTRVLTDLFQIWSQKGIQFFLKTPSLSEVLLRVSTDFLTSLIAERKRRDEKPWFHAKNWNPFYFKK